VSASTHRTNEFPLHAVPEGEFDAVIDLIRQHPEYGSTDYVRDAYVALGLEVAPDPHDQRLIDRIATALRAAAPMSVIRLGDGEMNLLTYGVYPNAAHLDRACVAAMIESQPDRFLPDERWMSTVADMMLSAVKQADVLGVLGLWRPNPPANLDERIERFRRNPRGGVGHWRAMDYMLRLARDGVLEGKSIASAHLYAGVLEGLDKLLTEPTPVLLITARPKVMAAMALRYPDCSFEQIIVGRAKVGEPLADAPDFLFETQRRLPQDLRGHCCLVGAGPWSEIYCGWIKDRGGVAIDLGSGFDLLDGDPSRRAHLPLGLDPGNKYDLGRADRRI
jgi:hypothetical protein